MLSKDTWHEISSDRKSNPQSSDYQATAPTNWATAAPKGYYHRVNSHIQHLQWPILTAQQKSLICICACDEIKNTAVLFYLHSRFFLLSAHILVWPQHVIKKIGAGLERYVS